MLLHSSFHYLLGCNKVYLAHSPTRSVIACPVLAQVPVGATHRGRMGCMTACATVAKQKCEFMNLLLPVFILLLDCAFRGFPLHLPIRLSRLFPVCFLSGFPLHFLFGCKEIQLLPVPLLQTRYASPKLEHDDQQLPHGCECTQHACLSRTTRQLTSTVRPLIIAALYLLEKCLRYTLSLIHI